MISRAKILAVLFLLCSSAWAEVYTIDFNRGTVRANSEYTRLTDNISSELICSSGASYFIASSIDDSYYNDKGCGLRIGQTSSSGQAFVIFTLSEAIQSKTIDKVVIYASRGTTNESANLEVTVGAITSSTISFANIKDYDSSYPASSNYMLPEINVNGKFKNLQVQARNTNYIILHRIDIVISEDNVTLPAQNGEKHYATFSSDKATFFPSDVTVSKVSVNDGHLVVTALETQKGFGTTGCYVPANTGVLLSSSNENTSHYTLEGETLDALTDNMLKPASEAMTGSGKFYKLAYDDYANKTGLGFYWGAEDGGAFTCSSGTAYLYVPTSSSVKGYVLDDAADEDAIYFPAEFVDEMGDIYNIAGQRVNKPSQGIYIRGGRKYVGK